VVAADEREEAPDGGRALLNLGHTFAHALEAECGYDGTLLHGEAVAVGLGLAASLSARLGHCSQEWPGRVMEHLATLGLPARLGDLGRGFSTPALIGRMRRDKKARDGALRFVLLRDAGDVFTAARRGGGGGRGPAARRGGRRIAAPVPAERAAARTAARVAGGSGDLEIFLATVPGLEGALRDEVRGKGFRRPEAVPGGVTFRGGWADAWRANLWLRGAGRVLVRFEAFRAVHLAQLDARARRVDWAAVLRPDVAFQVEATCRASRLYHDGAVAERIGRRSGRRSGPARARGGRDGDGAGRARPRHPLGGYLGRAAAQARLQGSRGARPMRETMAALFLRGCGYAGRSRCSTRCAAPAPS
jgi:hypothetical protein